MEAADDARVSNEGVPPQNQDLTLIHTSVAAFLSDYGWYLLFLGVGVYLLIQHLSKKRSGGNESQSASAVNQDPASVARRQEAVEVSRQRMQEELNARAEEFKEKQKRLEEEKRRQKIEMWESMKEGKSFKGNARVAQNTEEASSSTVLKPKTDQRLRNSGYNPLSGDGGGTCSWRPGRRGPSAGG
ncbi:selenoprotein S isoform X1 [Triplophysa rosa]|uniref:Selenoprotein S n=1 Tax=Triplophysa rosa TaxID=992332 RepID=A0A9W7X4Y6_TRIRA|nr:selenoprotein S isoform X1 [Triplophysa rosa]KAI7813844.1 putative selenoprotein S [Triplophysa rosa]